MSLASEAYRVLKKEGALSLAYKILFTITNGLKYQTYWLGSGRVCPICTYSGRKFGPAGNPPRREAQCPGCGARERHRLLWCYIKNEMEMFKDDKQILYLAPTQIIDEKLRERGNVVTVDLLMEDVDINADITQLPFNDSIFDVIICSHVLEHIPDDRVALSEMHRVLKSGGDTLLMVPKDKALEQTYEDDSITSPEARREEFGEKSHVRWYGKDFIQRLEDTGFDATIETYTENLNETTIDRFGLKVHEPHKYGDPTGYEKRVKYEDIHHCKKPSNTDD